MKNIICILVITLMTSSIFAQNDKEMKEFDSNFSHTVFFWLKNPDNAADRAAFETSLKKFLDNSGYAKTKFIGTPPRASRDVVDGSFTYSLILSFDSAESQQAYQDEAPHKLFISESENLWTRVIVYDSTSI
ncbi:Stress responsive A/B Barrel Domain [Maribacter orientalis]|uniref:Stress responsive A/B Barrel Domain n=1 Tax=Maribacter orientalis TaxID=228957 RepID=A0A1H7R6S3_9FLAO|nr:Dabb family protein [Maribacter orientalis]SEL55635.1 Stress responsive A/B Barrel Domain [Maribacter orientalis]